jgi:hypothetical protein
MFGIFDTKAAPGSSAHCLSNPRGSFCASIRQIKRPVKVDRLGDMGSTGPYDFFVNQNPGALPSVEHEEVLAVIVDVKKEALSVER